MKKIFTFLASVTMAASAFAQYDGGNQRNQGPNRTNDVVYNDNMYKKDNDNMYKKDNGRFDDRYTFSKREMEMKIAQINREYDYKIQSVKNRFFMHRFKKEQLIYKLECEKRDEIKAVYAKFNDRRNRFDDHDKFDKRKHW